MIGTHIIIGRSPVNDVTIDDPMISEKHCRINIIPDEPMQIEDLDSTNGTLINGKRMKKSGLKENDLIQIGKTKLRFVKEAS